MGTVPETAVVPAAQARRGDVISRRDIVDSRLWPNINSAERAGVVMAMAKNHGMDPCFVAANIAFVNGKPACSGLYLAAVLKKTRRYRYTVKERGPTRCVLLFHEKVDGKWEEIGPSTFSVEDAKRAGLLSNPTWTKYPDAMCFWRALSAGARMFAPDAVAGGCTYLIEEVLPDAEYDEDAVPVHVEVVLATPELVAEVRALCEQTGTPVAKVESHFGGPLGSLSGDVLAEALKLLRVKADAAAEGAASRTAKKE